jgi:putative phosphoribosyl transferase
VSTKTGVHPEYAVEILVDHRNLSGILTLPHNTKGLVLFAHGSGSSRRSPRNQFVAGILHDAGIATLLFDLLEESEAQDRTNVFDINLLAQRLEAAAAWSRRQPETRKLPLGYFGASTGAAATLAAAARRKTPVAAVVSRGGRPDLAGDFLPQVEAPTLLIVGGNDDEVLELNRQALARLRCPKELTLVRGATHLFEEPGALMQVAMLASTWFERYLQAATSAAT